MPALDSEPEVIFAYTRAQALADGVLVDASDLAREAGFVFPVALTETLYHGYIVPALDLVAEGQSIQGRLWDLLFVLRFAIAKARNTDTILFKVLFLMSRWLCPGSYRTQGCLRPRRRRRARSDDHAPR